MKVPNKTRIGASHYKKSDEGIVRGNPERQQNTRLPRYTIHTSHIRHAVKPRWNLLILPNVVRSCCLLFFRRHRLSLVGIARLFWLQGLPYGSCIFLLTLTISVPRLDTDCYLGHIRLGVPSTSMYDTELAYWEKSRTPPASSAAK